MKRLGQGLAAMLGGLLIVIVLRGPLGGPEPQPGPRPEPRSSPVLASGSGTAVASVESAAVSAKHPDAETKPVAPQPRTIVTQAWTPRPTDPYAARALAALRPRAEAGDTKAMIGIALALAACRDPRPTPADIDAIQRNSIAAGLGKLIDDEDIDAWKQSYARLDAYCSLTRNETVAEYNHWLQTAADAGDSEALVLAAQMPPLDFAESERRFKAILHSGQFTSLLTDADTALARRRADAAIAAGEIEGLSVARVLAEDPIDRYVYSVLLFNVDREDGKPLRSASGMERDGRVLRAADLAIAEQRIANTLAAVPVWIRRPPFPVVDVLQPPAPSP